MANKNPTKDAEREERIKMDILEYAYDHYGRAAGWYDHLQGMLQFPFTALCVAERIVSPLRVNDEVEVTGIAPAEECEREIFVVIRWGTGWEKDGLAVPLAQVAPIRADHATTQAVGDWHYWVGQGYQF